MICCVHQEEEAKRLVRDAIAAGIFNDLGSGSNIDLCVITKGKVDYLRPHDMANKKGVRWASVLPEEHLIHTCHHSHLMHGGMEAVMKSV